MFTLTGKKYWCILQYSSAVFVFNDDSLSIGSGLSVNCLQCICHNEKKGKVFIFSEKNSTV